MDPEFDDDDSLGALPDDTLQELEYAAISSTQKPKTINTAVPQPHIRTYGTTGLSRNGNINNKSHWRPPQPRQQPASKPPPQVPTAPPASAPAPLSSDYGFDEEDVIDLDEPSMVIQSTTSVPLPSRSRSEVPSRPPAARYNSRKTLDPETEAAFAAADAELATHQSFQNQWVSAPHLQPSATSLATSPAEVAALQARIDALLNEQTRLQQAEANARNAAQQKAGEIAIVRANHAKAEKEYERRIAVMQKMHADENAKAKTELEQGKKEREKLETDRRFLAHDFEQAKRERLSAGGGGGGTPRKKSDGKGVRASVFGDGFDGDEVMVLSPSRSKDREKEKEKNAGSREHTPRVGNKRKRGAVQDSPLPMPALSFSEVPGQVTRQESEKTVASDAAVASAKQQSGAEDSASYDFMQRLLRHTPYEGHDRSIESLTKHFLPSNTSRSLSSILLDDISIPSPMGPDIEPLPLRTSRALLTLWSRTLQETYYTPLYLILDLITFSLRFERASAIATLISQAIPLCVKTIELVANSTARAALYPSFAESEEYKKVKTEIAEYIDVDDVLDFLGRLCNAAAFDRGQASHSVEGGRSWLEVFWSTLDVNFVVLMLNKAQPISQITATLRMLATSALAETFGPICLHPSSTAADADAENLEQKQTRQENILLERLVSLLLDRPIVPEDESPYSDEENLELRLEILPVLRRLALTDHGRALLGRHPTAIGRLVRFLDGQIARLYSARPSLGLPLTDASSSTLGNGNAGTHVADTDAGGEQQRIQGRLHDLLVKTINATVRLLYHILLSRHSQHSTTITTTTTNSTQHPNNPAINLQHKLQSTRGGWHRFLVSFTRIAFSDQLVLEAGIEDAVVEAAHRVLDEVLTMEEGEAVCAAVETPRGTRGIVEGEHEGVEDSGGES